MYKSARKGNETAHIMKFEHFDNIFFSGDTATAGYEH